MKKENNARIMMIISMTIFGTIGLFVRFIPVSSGELALYRAVFAAVVIASFVPLILLGRIKPIKIIKARE